MRAPGETPAACPLGRVGDHYVFGHELLFGRGRSEVDGVGGRDRRHTARQEDTPGEVPHRTPPSDGGFAPSWACLLGLGCVVQGPMAAGRGSAALFGAPAA